MVEGNSGKVFEAGMTLMAGSRCGTPGRPYICHSFYRKPGQYYATILVPVDRLSDFSALREVPAPE